MTKARAEILGVLVELSDRFPEFRFGQMVVGLAWAAKDFTTEAVFDVEDEDLLAAARDLLARRTNSSANDSDSAGQISSLLQSLTQDDPSPSNA